MRSSLASGFDPAERSALPIFLHFWSRCRPFPRLFVPQGLEEISGRAQGSGRNGVGSNDECFGNILNLAFYSRPPGKNPLHDHKKVFRPSSVKGAHFCS
jgi:hypothetical protein